MGRRWRLVKLRVTSQPGQTPTMHVPRKKNKPDDVDEEDDCVPDPELRYSFQRNYKVDSEIMDYLSEIL